MTFLEHAYSDEPPRVTVVADAHADHISKETACAFILATGLLTAKELAKAKGVHLHTIYKWANQAPEFPEQAAAIRRLIGRN